VICPLDWHPYFQAPVAQWAMPESDGNWQKTNKEQEDE
jgi:hypothetical protein